MDNYFIDKSGKKRKAIFEKCLFCEKEFLTRQDQPSLFCCKQCVCKSKQKREIVNCSNCKKEFEKKISSKKKSKSGYFFCSRKCKDKSQRLGGIKEIMPNHYGSGKYVEYRNLYKELFGVDKLVCERCGYCEFECGVDVHHNDGNHHNNAKDNLKLLCSPCHRGLHAGLWIDD